MMITQEKISQSLSPRIFVFGSNLAGIHGKGAALHARKYYGAESGVAIGHIGQCYAIPTKDKNLRSLDLETIAHHVSGFLAYAKAHPNLEFNVTRIGCGLAGYKNEQIAPMFKGFFENLFFDKEWSRFLGSNYYYWKAPI